MRRSISFFTGVLMIMAMATGLSAQKIGYVNSTALLDNLTMMRSANSELEAVQKEYMTEGQNKVAALERDYQAYMQEANSGNLSQKQMQTKQAALEAQRQAILDYETKAQVTIETKRQAILTPILQKIDQVIQQYGKDNNYDFILDAGMGNLLFAKDGEDLTEVIRGLLEQ